MHTTTTSTTPVEGIPYEGGTVRLLQSATTRPGWAVGVFEFTTYRDEVVYFAARIGGRSFLRTSSFLSAEKAARTAANALFRKDRSR